MISRGDKISDTQVSLCDRIGNYLSELGKWSVWQNIILGQILSILLCTINVLSHYINENKSLVLPTGQNFIHYIFCMLFTLWLMFRCNDRSLYHIIKYRGWKYFLICLIDIQANTLMNTAHQFTSLTSIQLLGCVAIPIALALSCLVLGVRYRMVHIVAVSVCLLGVGCLVWANIEDGKTNGKNQLVGDMLCLGGAVLFAVVTILQELAIKNYDIVEYLGILGLLGSITCGVQMFLLEKHTIVMAMWKESLWILLSFAICQFLFCTLTSVFLYNSGTTALHLSLLSGNFYNLIIGILLLNYKFHAFYFLSYVLTMSGVYIYAIKKMPNSTPQLSSSRLENNHRSNSSECQRREHIISANLDDSMEMLPAAFGTMDSGSLPLSLSTNTTFTSFYGSQNYLQNNTTTSSA